MSNLKLQEILNNKQQLIIDFRESGCILTGYWKDDKHNSYIYNFDDFGTLVNTNPIIDQSQKKKIIIKLVEQTQQLVFSTKQNASVKSLFLQNLLKQLDNSDGSKIYTQGNNPKPLERVDVFQLIVLQMKRYTDENFNKVAQIKLVRSDEYSAECFVLFQQCLQRVYAASVQEYSPLKEFAIDLGTGFYMCSESDVVAKCDVKKWCFYANTQAGRIEKSQNEDEKVESTIYYSPNFDFESIPNMLMCGNFDYILENTRLAPQADWREIRYYKRYLYLEKFNQPIISRSALTSNLQLFVSKTQSVDLLHLFIIILLHIRKYVENWFETKDFKSNHNNQQYKSIADYFDVFSYSMPINSNILQRNFMELAFQTAFGSEGKKITLEVTTEPEAAFSYIIQNSLFPLDPNLQSKSMMLIDNNNIPITSHVFIIDGGDGTFDYVYAKFNEVDKNSNNPLWSKKYGSSVAKGGSNIRDVFFNFLNPLFGSSNFLLPKQVSDIQKVFENYTKNNNLLCPNFLTMSKGEGIPLFIADVQQHFSNISNLKISGQDILRCVNKQTKAEVPPKEVAQFLLQFLQSQNYQTFVKDYQQKQWQIELSPRILPLLECKINELCTNEKLNVRNESNLGFKQSYQSVQSMLREDKNLKTFVALDGEKYAGLVIFTGGMSKNNLLLEKIKQVIGEMNQCVPIEQRMFLVKTNSPQTSILKGIPVQRADISTRDFSKRADCGLYLLTAQNLKYNTPPQIEIEMQDKKKSRFTFGPQICKRTLYNVPEAVILPNAKLHSENNKVICGLRVPLGTKFYLTFLKYLSLTLELKDVYSEKLRQTYSETQGVKYPPPEYLNMECEQLRKLIDLKSVDVTITKDMIPSRAYNIYDGLIEIEIHLMFQHVKFHPNPEIAVCVCQNNGEPPIPVFAVENSFWAWYDEPEKLRQLIRPEWK